MRKSTIKHANKIMNKINHNEITKILMARYTNHGKINYNELTLNNMVKI